MSGMEAPPPMAGSGVVAPPPTAGPRGWGGGREERAAPPPLLGFVPNSYQPPSPPDTFHLWEGREALQNLIWLPSHGNLGGGLEPHPPSRKAPAWGYVGGPPPGRASGLWKPPGPSCPCGNPRPLPPAWGAWGVSRGAHGHPHPQTPGGLSLSGRKIQGNWQIETARPGRAQDLQAAGSEFEPSDAGTWAVLTVFSHETKSGISKSGSTKTTQNKTGLPETLRFLGSIPSASISTPHPTPKAQRPEQDRTEGGR